MRWLRVWFGLAGTVDRATYFLSGIILAAVKYAGDAALVGLAMGKLWSPIDYFNPIWAVRQAALGGKASHVLVPMALWALPFLWVGASMSMRRAADAGMSPWSALFFFVPGLNWVYIAALSLKPPAPVPPQQAPGIPPHVEERERFQSALLGVLAALPIGLLMVLFQVYGLSRYGSALFVGAPFSMGAVAGYVFNRRLPRSPGSTAAVGVLAVLIACAAVLAVALEGAICAAMAFPLAAALGGLGAAFGRAIALRRAVAWLAALVLALPAAGIAEGARPGPLREVVTSVEIDAPPERVWPHLIDFPELPPPTELLFRLGVAAPVRARIEGRGVGAVRRCEFTTGAFVEPITAWDEPRRLAFDVAAQPPPMLERSPYPGVEPPHLQGVLMSRKGEFRLEALPGGRTRLHGSTWYTLAIGPQGYWALWSERFIHTIHRRVLRHVKALAER